MNYRNSRDEQASPEMPAVAPLDLPAAGEPVVPRRRISPKSPRQVLQPEAAPPPPPRSQKARHPLVVVLNFFLMIVVLAVLASGVAFYLGKQEFSGPGPLAEPSSVLIARGADLDAISAQLKRHNVIDNPLVFTIAARLYDAEGRLKAGEYQFEPGVSMEQVLDDLVTGRAVLHSITFPEGLTSQQIVDRLKLNTLLTGDIADVPDEGSLMPDTYKFTRGETRQQILDRMQQAHARIVAEVWARRAPGLPIETPEELVILASIVEKETGRADERPRVAAVFINRLAQGMRLESDPTIIYGLYGGAGAPPGHEILLSEKQKPNRYNTYQIDGLPPGPIANPGRAALEAVANPSRTDELYFVADGTGGHAFASTFDEHGRNVERWRRLQAIEREAQRAAPEAGAEPEAAGGPAPAAATDGEQPGGEGAAADP
jgi:UPF0755 protein